MTLIINNIQILILFLLAPTSNIFAQDNKLIVPDSFEIKVYSDKIPNPRTMALASDQKTIFVGTRRPEKVYAIRDEDGDSYAEKYWTLYEKLSQPHGVAVLGEDLYISQTTSISVAKNILKNLKKAPKLESIIEGLPRDYWHGWKTIRFGPDGKLYFSVGSTCDACIEKNDIFATINRIDLKTKKVERVANGVRNSVGFDWHPNTKKFWFSDNGMDALGHYAPSCELNSLSELEQHFGWPYMHDDSNQHPELFSQKPKDLNLIDPVFKLGPHVAPLGIYFYRGSMFPKTFKNSLFVAEHASEAGLNKEGYRVKNLLIRDGKVIESKVFLKGWIKQTGEVWGKPTAFLELPDGSLLVSDDHNNKIYRISYKKSFWEKIQAYF